MFASQISVAIRKIESLIPPEEQRLPALIALLRAVAIDLCDKPGGGCTRCDARDLCLRRVVAKAGAR